MLDSTQMTIDGRVSATTNARVQPDPSRTAFGWSHRILILAVAGILFLTLYPFRFDFSRHLPRVFFPFSLGGWGKDIGRFDDFLNVLLFVPFGFGLAEKLRESSKSRLATIGIALAAGALLSYAVELLQIYIPQRDSGWEDVLTNSFGAVVGAMLFDLFGGGTLRLLSATERKARAWLTWRRAASVLTLYLGIWCVFTVRLQEEARLSNWNPDSLLVVGNSASNRFTSAWKGQIFALEIWDHSLSPESVRALTSGYQVNAADSDPIVAYRFLGSAPFQDRRHLLPDLSWMPQPPGSISASDVFLNGKSWLTSPSSISALVTDLEKTGQFSLRVLCGPADISGVDARIVSISSPSGAENMELRQKDASLVFWFRTPISGERPRVSWTVPETFSANEMRDILLSYDGATVSLFADGKRHGHGYELGPGAALAKLIRHIKTQELEGYGYIFYALIFFPSGCLLGIAWRSLPAHGVGRVSLSLGWVLPAVILEAVLIHVSGRALSLENVSLSILLAVGGSLWINADRASVDMLRGWNQLISAR